MLTDSKAVMMAVMIIDLMVVMMVDFMAVMIIDSVDSVADK